MADMTHEYHNAPPTMPRWVKLFAIIAVLLTLVVGVMLLGGEHGPQQHLPPEAGAASTSAEDSLPSGEDAHTPPFAHGAGQP